MITPFRTAFPLIPRRGCSSNDIVYLSNSRWIEKDERIYQDGKEWESADWEVFQREYFQSGDASVFLRELEMALVDKFYLTDRTTLTRHRQGNRGPRRHRAR